jgi:hypothetical protein
VLHASSEADFDQNFAMMAKERVGGLIVQSDPFFRLGIAEASTLALRDRAQGPVEGASFRGYRATALSEDIWREKIRGCSCRGGASYSMSASPDGNQLHGEEWQGALCPTIPTLAPAARADAPGGC